MSFVVNYVANISGHEYSVVRYDTAHGFPHKDICLPKGRALRKEPMMRADMSDLVDVAIDDLKEHWEMYRRRFERWLK